MTEVLIFLAGAAVGMWWGDLYREPPGMSPWEQFTRSLWNLGYRFRKPDSTLSVRRASDGSEK